MVIFLQPFSMLPFIYCISFLFDKENVAVLSLLLYQIIFQWLLPFLISAIRLSYSTEQTGDAIYSLLKWVPLESSASSIFYNSKVLWGMHRFREFNLLGEGEEIKKLESDDMNGPADVFSILVHMVLFWLILLFILEYKIPCLCCGPIKRISRGEQAQFVKTFKG